MWRTVSVCLSVRLSVCLLQLRHFSPQAFRFYMEQHVENVLATYTQRLVRHAQLEAEMSQCQLSAATRQQFQRMLAQKESNHLRLRRAKMHRSVAARTFLSSLRELLPSALRPPVGPLHNPANNNNPRKRRHSH